MVLTWRWSRVASRAAARPGVNAAGSGRPAGSSQAGARRRPPARASSRGRRVRHLRRGGLGEGDRHHAFEQAGGRPLGVVGRRIAVGLAPPLAAPRRSAPNPAPGPGQEARHQRRRLAGAGPRLERHGAVEDGLGGPARRRVAVAEVGVGGGGAGHPSSSSPRSLSGLAGRRQRASSAASGSGVSAAGRPAVVAAQPAIRRRAPESPRRQASATAHQRQRSGSFWPAASTRRGAEGAGVPGGEEGGDGAGEGVAEVVLARRHRELAVPQVGLEEQVAPRPGAAAGAGRQRIGDRLETGALPHPLEEMLTMGRRGPGRLGRGPGLEDRPPGLEVGQAKAVVAGVDAVRLEVEAAIAAAAVAHFQLALDLDRQGGHRPGRAGGGPVGGPRHLEVGQRPFDQGAGDARQRDPFLAHQPLGDLRRQRRESGGGRPGRRRRRSAPGRLEVRRRRVGEGGEDDPFEHPVDEVAEQERVDPGEGRQRVRGRLEPEDPLEKDLPRAGGQPLEEGDVELGGAGGPRRRRRVPPSRRTVPAGRAVARPSGVRRSGSSSASAARRAAATGPAAPAASSSRSGGGCPPTPRGWPDRAAARGARGGRGGRRGRRARGPAGGRPSPARPGRRPPRRRRWGPAPRRRR